MRYIINDNHNPYYNLALEEYLSKNFTREFFMLWQNSACIVVGRNQDTVSEINVDFVKSHDITVLRRLTGGGAAYHDLGNINYTFIVNDVEKNLFDFKKHTQTIIEVLHKLCVDAEFTGRNDLTINGKKFSGNSQYRYKNRFLHHGTLLYNSSINDIFSSLNVNKTKFEGKNVKSVISRVTNISEHLNQPLSMSEFKEMITQHIMNSHKEFELLSLNDDMINEVKQLEKDKYATWDWNYGNSPSFTFSNRKKFEAGIVEVFLTVANGVIQNARLKGDFFGRYDICNFEKALCSTKYDKIAVRETLSSFELSRYFLGINIDDLECSIMTFINKDYQQIPPKQEHPGQARLNVFYYIELYCATTRIPFTLA